MSAINARNARMKKRNLNSSIEINDVSSGNKGK
jgi:hypothetical protein